MSDPAPHWLLLAITSHCTSLTVIPHRRVSGGHTSLAVIWRSYLTGGHLAVIPHWRSSGGHTSLAVIWRSYLTGGHMAVIWRSYLTGGHAPVHKNLGRVAPAILDHRLGGIFIHLLFKIFKSKFRTFC
jgi:hypothetical protein